MSNTSQPTVVRFGAYDFALQTQELHKHGMRVRLEGQPVAILKLLLSRPGELVTREELQQALWPGDTFVDFDHSLNAAVKRLRAALNDSADQPRYIETLARRGYRFIAPIDVAAGELEAAAAVTAPLKFEPPRMASATSRWRTWLLATTLCVVVLGFMTWRLSMRHPTATLPAIRSLAVLPLENLSGDPSQEYLADGMTEELIGKLSHIHGLRVISRTSAMHFKHTQLSMAEIAQALQVDAVVEGSIMREGKQVRVHAQLIRCATDEHIWAGEYRREAGSILGVQEDVARNIARRIQITLTPQEAARLTPQSTEDAEAHEDYLKGRYYFNQRTAEAVNKSIGYFQQAIARDPNYALAYSGMADAYSMLGLRAGIPSKDSLFRAKTAASKAVALDPTLADPHASLAFLAETHEWDWLKAEREYQLALQLDPDDARAHHWYAGYLMYVGRLDEGIAEERLARELDPLSLPINNALAGRLLVAERYEDALQQVKKTLELNPQFAAAHQTLGWIYLNQGKNREAIGEFQRAVRETGPEDTDFALDLAFANASVGDREEARTTLTKLKILHAQQRVPSGSLAILYGALGEKDQAFAWLEKAFEERDPELTYLQVPRRRFEPLRADPRFREFVRRIGFPARAK